MTTPKFLGGKWYPYPPVECNVARAFFEPGEWELYLLQFDKNGCYVGMSHFVFDISASMELDGKYVIEISTFNNKVIRRVVSGDALVYMWELPAAAQLANNGELAG